MTSLVDLFEQEWDRSQGPTGRMFAALRVVEALNPEIDAAGTTLTVLAADDRDLVYTTIAASLLYGLKLALIRLDEREDRFTAIGTDLSDAVSLLLAEPAGTA